MYALNDFDDTYSVSDAADLSMMSESLRHMRGLPFLEAGHKVAASLQPTSQVMQDMAANSRSRNAKN